MSGQSRPDLNQVREALRRHDERHAAEDEPREPPEPQAPDDDEDEDEPGS
jgi:hypothetical protein